jgi:transcriptional regulator with XRE-family HTH domain
MVSTASLMRIRQIKEIEVVGLGEKIKQARKKSGKSIETLCGEVGVSKTYWYEVEKETIKGCLSIENLKAIEIALNCNFEVSSLFPQVD